MNSRSIDILFSSFLANCTCALSLAPMDELILGIFTENYMLWQLEDSARMSNLGDHHIARKKRSIDEHNQTRNLLIRRFDQAVYKKFIILNNAKKRCSETPGMLIDRLSILYIKRFFVEKLLSLIEEKNLKKEYSYKKKSLDNQINLLGIFLNNYLSDLKLGQIDFAIYEPIKIYNDARIKKYIIALLREEKKGLDENSPSAS